MNKILITGSHGYIGSHLRKIIDAYDCVDLKLSSDITDSNLDLTPYSTIIHLAAFVQVGESVERPAEYYRNNILGTLNLIDKFQGDNFIFASTGAAAGDLNSPYALSKKACEEIIQQQARIKNFNYTIFRFYNVIGADFGLEATNADGLFYALQNASRRGSINIYGSDYATHDGTCIRDYVHVMEICDAIKTAIDTPANNIEPLGHGRGYSVKEIVERFRQINNLNFEINYADRRAGDIEYSVLDNPSHYLKSKYTLDDMLKIK